MISAHFLVLMRLCGKLQATKFTWSLISRRMYFFSSLSGYVVCFLKTTIPSVSFLPSCHLLSVVWGFKLIFYFQSWQERQKSDLMWNFRNRFFTIWRKNRQDTISLIGQGFLFFAGDLPSALHANTHLPLFPLPGFLSYEPSSLVP